jgi:hypothetical protein
LSPAYYFRSLPYIPPVLFFFRSRFSVLSSVVLIGREHTSIRTHSSHTRYLVHEVRLNMKIMKIPVSEGNRVRPAPSADMDFEGQHRSYPEPQKRQTIELNYESLNTRIYRVRQANFLCTCIDVHTSDLV